MRNAFLSLMLITAIAASGAGIWAATASDVYEATDGYGITTFAK